MIKVQVNSFGTNSVGNFSMKFANGYTVSLAMGGGGIYSSGNQDDGYSSVEVAAWDADGTWIKLGDNNDVIGWQSPEEVLAIMNKVAAM